MVTPGIENDSPLYTYDWDTAFGIPVPLVNKAIVDKKSSPSGFSYAEDTFNVSGGFGDWQITRGGDGKNVRFHFPLKNIILTYTSTGKQIQCPDGTAVIEVNLHYIPHTGAAGAYKGTPHALVVKHTADSSVQPAFVLISLALSPDVGTISNALIQEGLKNWGNEHLNEFNHIFNVVDLNRMIDKDQWGFVTPNYISYAYLDGETPETSTLGVLCMTGYRTGTNLAEQISSNIIPQGSKAGFAISQARTLKDLVGPAVCHAYKGLDDTNFMMNQEGDELYLKDGVSLDLGPVEHDGSTYYPKLVRLNLKSNGKLFIITSFTETEVSPGITAACQATNWYTIELGNSKNGQTLAFKEAQKGDVQHSIHHSVGLIITEIVISIAAAIALIILTVATEGAVLIVGGLVIGLIMGAVILTPDIIDLLNTDDSPAIDLLTVNAVDPIKWTGSSDFNLNYACQNVSMQLGGTPLFV
ncbi:MAG TPA: TULIP family P47-like protein [Desulfitobacteriaceae bacterium]|nr:TULIP family P47-like protein [Desulfitobacteriaceae bacterium]